MPETKLTPDLLPSDDASDVDIAEYVAEICRRVSTLAGEAGLNELSEQLTKAAAEASRVADVFREEET